MMPMSSLDRDGVEIQNIKSELTSVKLAVKDIDQRTVRIEQKLDTVAIDHEQRITKLEAVR